VTICIPNPGRETAIASSLVALKHGGYYLFYGISPSELVRTNPGPEPNSGVFPRTGKFEKQYARDELLEAYRAFNLVRLDEIEGQDIIEGSLTKYSMWVAIFQKK